ncbi:SagB family peptide dehydrogenase [Paenibacillus tarimensis]
MEFIMQGGRVRRGRWIASSQAKTPPAERVRVKQKAAGTEARRSNPFYLAELYHENSKYRPDLMSALVPHPKYAKPDVFGTGEWLEVPGYDALPGIGTPLGEALRTRRSSWDFHDAITMEELSVLLQYAFGSPASKPVSEDGVHWFELKYRTYPSGGALYPTDIYLYANRVSDLEKGLYRFSSYESRLYTVVKGNLDARINALTSVTDPERNPLFGSNTFAQAAVFIFISLNFTNQSDKYRLRAYRLGLLEAGHAAQNVLLAAAATGMTGAPLAGFYDDRANGLLGLDGLEQTVVYMIPLGKKKGERKA